MTKNSATTSGAAEQRRVPSRRRRGTKTVVHALREFEPHALAIEEYPPSPFTSLLLWALAGLLISGLLWSWFSQIPIMTTAPGKFTFEGSTRVVQSLNSGTIKNILSKVGETVAKGQTLVVLNSAVDRAKLSSNKRQFELNDLMRQRILGELGVHTNQMAEGGTATGVVALENHLSATEMAAQRSKISGDRAQLRAAGENLSAGKALLIEYERRDKEDRTLAKMAQPLVDKGALSGMQYSQLKSAVIQDDGQLANQRYQVQRLQQALISAKSQLQSDRLVFRTNQYQALESVVTKGYELSSDYAAASRNAALDELRSPVDGVVQSLDVASIGSVVQAGQTVATVVPNKLSLKVEVDLPAKDAGFVRLGQRTKIKVTAFPFEQYGSIPGKVVWISPTAESTQDLSALPAGESHHASSPPSQGPAQSGNSQGKGASPPTLYYRVLVEPTKTWLDVNGQRQTLHAGMTASVDIATGERRIIDFFLDPMIKYANNGLTVR